MIAAVRERSDRKARRAGHSREQLERELHEGALQTLFGVGLNLQVAVGLAADPALRERLASAAGQIEEVVRDLRNYILGLRPGTLADPPDRR